LIKNKKAIIIFRFLPLIRACSIGSNLHRVGFIVSGFKVSGFKGKCGATKAEFILICTTGNKKICPALRLMPLIHKITALAKCLR
jgi:hypothetical protein